jgi:hypothetical protein
VAAVARKLRVGVFADAPMQPRWLFEALAQVAAADCAELSLVCTGEAARRETAPALWRAFESFDTRFVARRDVSSASDIRLLAPGSRRAQIDPRSAAGNVAVRALGLDVAVVLGDVDPAPLERVARFGSWRYAFGDAHDPRERLAGVHEVVSGSPTTSVAIRIRANGSERIACRSWSRTLDWSVAQNRANLFSKASAFLARSLAALHARGQRWLDEETVEAAGAAACSIGDAPLAIRNIPRLGAKLVARALERAFTVGQWSIAFRFAQQESWEPSLAGFHRLAPPRDRFWADPFPLVRGERAWIFFEELEYGAGKADISVVEVDRAGRASRPRKVLQRDYHLSYPSLIEDGGELYMIPESAGNHTVEIYRCVEFPHRWRREKVLIDGLWCADATVWRAEDRWWMFVNTGNEGAEIHDELHIFSAPRLLGPWSPHPRNPVKSDIRCARPAGSLFTEGGALYRPAQICAPIYGAGVSLQRVTKLTPHEYAEVEERRILPPEGAGFIGMHTINRAGDLSVADVFARRSRF